MGVEGSRGGKEFFSEVSDEDVFGSWFDDWPVLASTGEFNKYLNRFERPVISSEKVAERSDRDTSTNSCTVVGNGFERRLAGMKTSMSDVEGEIDLSMVEGDERSCWSPVDILTIPENNIERSYDALIPVEDEDCVSLKEVQIKGCFHSRKDNPNRSSHIVIPYDTHRDSKSKDYFYHVGTYSLDDEILEEDQSVQVPVWEAVFTHEEMDAFMQYSKWLDPTGVSTDRSNNDRLRAQISPEILVDYAEAIHQTECYGGEEISKNQMYKLIEQVCLENSQKTRIQQTENGEYLDALEVPEIQEKTSNIELDDEQASLSDYNN